MSQSPKNTRPIETGLPDGPAVVEAGGPLLDEASALNRRRFLEAAGFSLSMAAVSGCGRAPVKNALPAPAQPVGAIPGRLQYFASTCTGCSANCGWLVGTRDGRPLKMEGLPEHPLSNGGLCAVGQAIPLSLYDSQRLSSPRRQGADEKWADEKWATIDAEIGKALEPLKNDSSTGLRLVTPTVTSPTLQATIDTFLGQFKNAKQVVFDTDSSSAILDAHQQTHAARLLPHYRFDLADVIVSFGADFLGTWISPVEFTAAWSKRRAPTHDAPEMSFHAQFESRMSLTGSNADQRHAIPPQEQGSLAARLTEKVAQLAGTPLSEPLTTSPSNLHEKVLDDLAHQLWEARGKSLVVSDSQQVPVQKIINQLNHLLGNYDLDGSGKSPLDLHRPSQQRQGNDREVEQLIQEIESNEISALLVLGVDLLHELPERQALADAIGRIPLTVSFAQHNDSFASAAKYVCPDHHALESWGDAQPVAGLMSLAQPTLLPLGDTRSALESLALWAGQPATAYEAIQSYWEKTVYPKISNPEKTTSEKTTSQNRTSATFSLFWEQALQAGFVEIAPGNSPAKPFDITSVKPLEATPSTSDFSLVLYHKIGMPSSQHAHNPWLHELPDPISKVTWGNYVCVSPSDGKKLYLKNGDLVTLSAGADGPKLELPALLQQGQQEGVLAVALHYGCKGTDRFAKIGPQWFEARPTVPDNEQLGKNAAAFVEFRDGGRQRERPAVTIAKTGRHRDLAITQLYHSLDVPAEVAPHGAEHREIVEQTTLAAFAKDSHAGAVVHHGGGDQQLWPEDHTKEGHAWGMVIDLNKCTGCSACVIACQSENNVPVVGYDEVRRQREMHWIRIDRYYTGEGADMHIDHQPMMCQHCGNAPCETVCPVLATVHSSEGLNEQVYNRCVGTRYCANNCPYKVRRFNWFRYPHDDSLQNLVLNPEVTVRSRGVMEKCSMCVQRIEAGKIDARSQGEPLADGAIQTACQQSCPSQAILFGDMNGEHLLFGFPSTPENRPVAGKLPDIWRQAFEENQRPLPTEAQFLEVEKKREWQLDFDSRQLTVKLEGETLNVYQKSRVHAAQDNPRRYRVLEEINVRPSVSYLRVVKNRDEEPQHG